MSKNLREIIEDMRRTGNSPRAVAEFNTLIMEVARLVSFAQALLIVYDKHTQEEAAKIVGGVMAGEQIEVKKVER